VPPLETTLLAIAIVTVAAALQASIGFGLALVAAPLLALLDRTYVPGPLMVQGLALGLIMSWRERGAIDRVGLRAAAVGRVLGVIPAGYALSVATQATFDVLFSTLVLAAVGLSLLHPVVRPTPRAVLGAGVLSGFMGTITAIGGPPMALVYQSAGGPILRATLAAIFVIGSIVSLAALALIGRFGVTELRYAAPLLIGVVLGTLVSHPLLGLFDRGATRPLVLGLSAVSALVVLARAVW
jgi:uncharacterized membrane protein YfcA